MNKSANDAWEDTIIKKYTFIVNYKVFLFSLEEMGNINSIIK